MIAVLYRPTGARAKGRVSWAQAMPLFVPGFLLAACIGTVGDLGSRPFGLLSKETWGDGLKAANWLSQWCLTLAMVAVGLGTGLANLRKLGLRPFVVGLATAILVGGISLGLLAAARLAGWV